MSTSSSVQYERKISHSRRVARREMFREKIESWNIRERIQSFFRMIKQRLKKPFEINNNAHQERIYNVTTTLCNNYYVTVICKNYYVTAIK